MEELLFKMTLEELWKLFPITLSAHKSCWKDWYEEERQAIAALMPSAKIHHIGSTAIPHIWAKPIVDILLEIPAGTPMEEIKPLLVNSGWLCMCTAENSMSFNKGYTSQGYAERVFHVHLRYEGDNDELYFRDYMNSHPALAEEYERLKCSLWKQFAYDRNAYTGAKSAFIRKYTDTAKAEYGNRYGAARMQHDTEEERG